MTTAIGAASSLPSPTPGSSAISRAGLQTELARLKKEHSACVNCDSASTQSGKSNIQKLENQIGTIESRINTQSTSTQIVKSTSPAIDSGMDRRLDVYA